MVCLSHKLVLRMGDFVFRFWYARGFKGFVCVLTGLLNAEVEAADSDTQAGNKGSCSCYCPPGQGFGQCFPAASSADCDKASLPAARVM